MHHRALAVELGGLENSRLDGRAVCAGRHLDDRPAILDAPPGTSCPVIAAVRGADLVLLVTEPTAFGLHDLTLAVAMARALALPVGIVINRAGMGDDRVEAYCAREGLPVLARLPHDRRVAEAYARGVLAVDAVPETAAAFHALAAVVTREAGR